MSFDVVAKNGNNIEATFDFVERIVRLAAFDNVASTFMSSDYVRCSVFIFIKRCLHNIVAGVDGA